MILRQVFCTRSMSVACSKVRLEWKSTAQYSRTIRMNKRHQHISGWSTWILCCRPSCTYLLYSSPCSKSQFVGLEPEMEEVWTQKGSPLCDGNLKSGMYFPPTYTCRVTYSWFTHRSQSPEKVFYTHLISGVCGRSCFWLPILKTLDVYPWAHGDLKQRLTQTQNQCMVLEAKNREYIAYIKER